MVRDPWPHIVIDNFLDDYDWHLEQVKPWREMGGSSVKLRKSIKQTERHPVVAQYLGQLPHRPYERLKADWYYSIQYKGFEYPMHQEWDKKILSVVVYLGESGCGTDLYNVDQTPWGAIEWKPNRAFIFAGQEGVTWHSYKVGDHAVRTTLNGFLMNDI